MPASDCYLLIFFYTENVAYMHLLFDDVRYSPDASSMLITSFVADMKCGLYEINKNN